MVQSLWIVFMIAVVATLASASAADRGPPQQLQQQQARNDDENYNYNYDAKTFRQLLLSSSSSSTSQTRNNKHNNIQPKIVDGVEAKLGEFPYYVRRDSYNTGVCGASLIYNDIVLTAAHCQGAFQDGVRVGYRDPTNAGVYRNVTAQRRHPNYNFNNRLISHDILLLKLESPVTAVEPVKINGDPDIPVDFEKVTLCGTGRTVYEGFLPSTLRKTDLYYMPSDICSTAMGDSSNIVINDDILCAGFPPNNESPCNGDSGGPLIRVIPGTEEQQHEQVGVVSFGKSCGTFSPNGFARISTFYDWIQEQICVLSSNPPSDCPATVDPPSATAIEVAVEIQYPSDPYETTFSVRDRRNSQIVYAGPQNNPQSLGRYVSTLYLEPGPYRFEMYDEGYDGLTGYPRDGSFQIWARYGDGDDTMVVLVEEQSGEEFSEKKVDFLVPDKVSAAPSDVPSNVPTMVPSDIPSSLPTSSTQEEEQPPAGAKSAAIDEVETGKEENFAQEKSSNSNTQETEENRVKTSGMTSVSGRKTLSRVAIGAVSVLVMIF